MHISTNLCAVIVTLGRALANSVSIVNVLTSKNQYDKRITCNHNSSLPCLKLKHFITEHGQNVRLQLKDTLKVSWRTSSTASLIDFVFNSSQIDCRQSFAFRLRLKLVLAFRHSIPERRSQGVWVPLVVAINFDHSFCKFEETDPIHSKYNNF